MLVTHDQDEALTLADRVVVFDAGRVEQVGSAREVYERPATPFVAGFVGTSNLLRPDAARALLGREGTWSVRPEKIRLAAPDAAAPRIPNASSRLLLPWALRPTKMFSPAPGSM